MMNLFRGGRRDDQRWPQPSEGSGCKNTALAIGAVLLVTLGAVAYGLTEAARAIL